MSNLIDVGVTDTGFQNTTRDDIYAKIGSRLKASFGSQFDTSQESPDGQVIAVVADLAKQLLDINEQTYYSYSPSHAFGQGLTNITALNRVERFINTATRVTVALGGVAGTIVPAGSLVGDDVGNEFKTLETATLPFSVTAECTVTGEIAVAAGQITKVITQINGWNTVSNNFAGQTGVTYEEDPQLRARRENSTILTNNGPMDAIYEELISMGLQYVTIIENDTAADIDGQPSGTFQVIVDGGAESEIAKVISKNKALGVRTYGTISVTILDSKGYEKVINFSRSVSTEVFVEIDIKRLKGSSNDSTSIVQKAVVDYLNTRNIGESVYWSEMIGNITDNTELVSVRRLVMGRTSGSLTTDDLAVLRNEKPIGLLSGVIVNVLS